MRIHTVTFCSPGTLFSEEKTLDIHAWDPALAVEMSARVSERYGAKPFGFYFRTLVAAPDVPDGEGGVLKVEPREVARSGMHFIGGTILTIEDIEARRDPRNDIMLTNMRCNDWPIVIENTNSFVATLPFLENAVVVDAHGVVTERGDTAERVSFRALKVRR